jgi:hypothetical protein|tara:strand:+ start:103 stop:240 length:138 start_codon:yes stop_codon:yes gene_type:complete
MEVTTLLPMLENNITPLIVWVLVYFTMVKGIRRDLEDIKDKIEKK